MAAGDGAFLIDEQEELSGPLLIAVHRLFVVNQHVVDGALIS